MPIIRIENVGTLTKNQKDELIERMTDVVYEVTSKDKKYIYVKIEEIQRENFGIGGQSLG